MVSSVAISIQRAAERSSWIRQMFEQGQKLKEQFGEDNVFDYSLGNPVLEPPPEVYAGIKTLLYEGKKGQHRYMPNCGFVSVREYIAEELYRETALKFKSQDIVMSVGAGGGLNVVLKALLDQGDEVLVLSPYFVEYGFYVGNHGGVLTVAPTDNEFQPNLKFIEQKITKKTKIVLINSPNNPTGVVYSQKIINRLGKLIGEKERLYGHPIFLLSDEPYRKIIFDGLQQSHVFLGHKNSIMVTSHSKDLGLAGERIGYIAVHPEIIDRTAIQNAMAFTTRTLGFVNAPALMQRILPALKDITVPIDYYQKLRDLLYTKLTDLGFKIVFPQGAFYLFPKSPIEDDIEFVKEAQNKRILLVPGSGFGMSGHFRISYCVTETQINRSLPYFEELANKYGLC